jgi:hypothetical protein
LISWTRHPASGCTSLSIPRGSNLGHEGKAAGQGQAFRYCLIVLVFINDVPTKGCVS